MSAAGTVLHLSTTDGTGGAARAARRLHDGLTALGWESWIVSGLAHVGGERTTTVTRATAERVPGPMRFVEELLPYLNALSGEMRLPRASARRLPATELFARSRVINLHNLHGSWFDYAVLPRYAAAKPIVWTLHDMWPLTGHCAYSFDCSRWETGCHHCPMWRGRGGLDEIRRTPWDNSRGEWRRKRRTYAQTPITVVAPSRWLARLAEQSILRPLAVHHVPYGLDTRVYAPMHRMLARQLVGLPGDALVAMFNAASLGNERKGVRQLIEAAALVRRTLPELQLLAIGASADLASELRDARMVGAVSDEHLQRALYCAADIVVVPSLADNQPLVMLEALACGVPVVAYEVGGISETVRHMETGHLARAGDAAALAEAMLTLLCDTDTRARLGAGGRALVEREHDLVRQAERYAEIYCDLNR